MSISVDQFSFSTIPVQQLVYSAELGSSSELGTATSFVWKRNGQHYLITNWHVATCRNAQTGDNLHNHGGHPNVFGLLINSSAQQVQKVIRHLNIRDEHGAPLWFVHPTHNRNVDVVAIPMPEPDAEVAYYPINLMNFANLRSDIGMDVFILGYPFDIEFPAYPVWKRGSIASEPDLASRLDLYILVDSASRPGMSGGPVIRRSWGSHIVDEGNVRVDGAIATSVVGVYSGRLHTKDTNDPQLARVWPIRLVDEIIDAAVRDTEY